MELEVIQSVLKLSGVGERVALATVVETRGSVPRKAGSKMAVAESGRIVGTVGGGCGEAQVVEAAWETLRDGEPRMVFVDLTEAILENGIVTGSEAVCGGTMRVFVELADRR